MREIASSDVMLAETGRKVPSVNASNEADRRVIKRIAGVLELFSHVYYEPKTTTNKVRDDAVHLEGSNHDMYRSDAVVASAK